jgi:hypothetical protein
MDFSSINWLAVVACVVFSMVSGSLWFGPKTFFPIWWKAIGMKEGDTATGSPLTWALIIVSSVVQAVFMALMVTAMGSLTGGATLASGATAGFMLWLGFVAPTGLANKLFSSQLKAWAIETGNHLINFVVFGAILGAWR